MLSPAGERHGIIKKNAADAFVRPQMSEAVPPDARAVEIERFESDDALAHELAINDENNTIHENLHFFLCGEAAPQVNERYNVPCLGTVVKSLSERFRFSGGSLPIRALKGGFAPMGESAPIFRRISVPHSLQGGRKPLRRRSAAKKDYTISTVRIFRKICTKPLLPSLASRQPETEVSDKHLSCLTLIEVTINSARQIVKFFHVIRHGRFPRSHIRPSDRANVSRLYSRRLWLYC